MVALEEQEVEEQEAPSPPKKRNTRYRGVSGERGVAKVTDMARRKSEKAMRELREIERRNDPEQPVWNRLPSEPEREYEWFQMYLKTRNPETMKRSRALVSEAVFGTDNDSRVGRATTKYHWSYRANAYDLHQEAQRRHSIAIASTKKDLGDLWRDRAVDSREMSYQTGKRLTMIGYSWLLQFEGVRLDKDGNVEEIPLEEMAKIRAGLKPSDYINAIKAGMQLMSAAFTPTELGGLMLPDATRRIITEDDIANMSDDELQEAQRNNALNP